MKEGGPSVVCLLNMSMKKATQAHHGATPPPPLFGGRGRIH